MERYICDLFKEKLEVDIAVNDIDFIRRLGRGDKNNTPVLVGFATFRNKLLVMRNILKLKGLKVLISNDFAKEVREKRKHLWPQVLEARKEREVKRRG